MVRPSTPFVCYVVYHVPSRGDTVRTTVRTIVHNFGCARSHARSGYEMRESTILKRRSGGDGIQTPRVRCTPTTPVRN